jgi:dipeptidyl aminopeptidase/acylaminoacyl peptidase
MVRYPGESHLMFAFGRPDRRVDRLERIVDWFERHL